MREFLSAFHAAYKDFVRKRRLLSMLVSLLLAAACAGAVYLAYAQLSRL